jgi:ABC-type multidrug transport system ATPase subunit
MDEASRCDRVALIQNGKIMSIDTPDSIRNNYGMGLWAVKADDTYRLLSDLRQFKYTRTAFPFGEHIHLSLSDESVKPAEIEFYLHSTGHSNVSISKIEPSIEDCFMEMMSEESSFSGTS